MSDILSIGQYQLENLLRQQVRFLYFDLRDAQSREVQGSGHRLLANAKPVEPGALLDVVTQSGVPKDYPIVLICENGSKSMDAAKVLAQNSYINVYVVLGGTADLELT